MSKNNLTGMCNPWASMRKVVTLWQHVSFEVRKLLFLVVLETSRQELSVDAACVDGGTTMKLWQLFLSSSLLFSHIFLDLHRSIQNYKVFYHFVFMSNLILILLIAIFFCFRSFLKLIFFSILFFNTWLIDF
jgi:hypothetical protein